MDGAGEVTAIKVIGMEVVMADPTIPTTVASTPLVRFPQTEAQQPVHLSGLEKQNADRCRLYCSLQQIQFL